VAACSGGGSPDASSPPAADTSTNANSSSQELATVGDIPVGGGVIIAEPAIVVTQPVAGTIKAFTAICTHQGCLVGEVVDNQIICPCHGARYSAEDGSVLQGPAEEPLAPSPVLLDGDRIVVG
jgi:Rieske Fe-S protein